MKFPPFAPLKSFFAAAEASDSGRLRAAAAELGLTESAVSHQVKRLEEYLGTALFERHGRELRLTPAGARFHRAIRPGLAAIQAATDDMMAPRRQRVTITAPTSIAAFWLMPRLARLQEHHASVDLQLVATNRLCDLGREQIDLAIRYGAGQWRGLEARRLMPELYFPVASAEFLHRNRGKDPAELLRTSRTISNALHPDEWTEWCGAHGLQPPRTSNMIELSSAELVVPALLDGVGIGIGRRPIIDPLLQEGRLVPLFRDRAIGKAAYYLVQSPTSRSAAARTVAEWLMAEGRAMVEAGSGDAVAEADRSGRSKKAKKTRGQKK
jgi:LysR family transcriptional regulator, glycine cleavage system transcriptional activator